MEKIVTVSFFRGNRGDVIAKHGPTLVLVDRQWSATHSLPNDGDVWEVRVVRKNQERTVWYVLPVNRLDTYESIQKRRNEYEAMQARKRELLRQAAAFKERWWYPLSAAMDSVDRAGRKSGGFRFWRGSFQSVTMGGWLPNAQLGEILLKSTDVQSTLNEYVEIALDFSGIDRGRGIFHALIPADYDNVSRNVEAAIMAEESAHHEDERLGEERKAQLLVAGWSEALLNGNGRVPWVGFFSDILPDEVTPFVPWVWICDPRFMSRSSSSYDYDTRDIYGNTLNPADDTGGSLRPMDNYLRLLPRSALSQWVYEGSRFVEYREPSLMEYAEALQWRVYTARAMNRQYAIRVRDAHITPIAPASHIGERITS